jgi:hypothetical protein
MKANEVEYLAGSRWLGCQYSSENSRRADQRISGYPGVAEISRQFLSFDIVSRPNLSFFPMPEPRKL